MAGPLEWIFKLLDEVSGPANKITGALDKTTDAIDKSTKEILKQKIAMAEAALEVPRLEQKLHSLTREQRENEERTKKLRLEWGNMFHSFAGFRKEAEGGWTFNVAEGLEGAHRIAERLVETVKSAVEFGADFVKDVFKAGAQGEKTGLAYNLILGKEKAEELLGVLDEVAAKSKYDDDELRALALPLVRSGVGARGIREALHAGADIEARGGDMATFLGQVKRITDLGRLSARSLGELGVPVDAVFRNIAKLTGGTEKGVKKLAESEGKLDPQIILKGIYGALSEKTGGVLGAGGLQAATTLDGLVHKIQQIPENIFKKIQFAPAFAEVKQFLGNVLDAFDPDSEFGRRISDALNKSIGGVFHALFGEFSGEGGKEKMLAFFESLPEKIDHFGESIKGVLPDLHELAVTFKAIVDALAPVAKFTATTLSAGGTQKQGASDYDSALDRAGHGGAYKFLFAHTGRGDAEVARQLALEGSGGAPQLAKANDFIWRGGRAIQIDPNDSVMGFKSGGSLGLDEGMNFRGGGDGAASMSSGATMHLHGPLAHVEVSASMSDHEIGERVKGIAVSALVSAAEEMGIQLGTGG